MKKNIFILLGFLYAAYGFTQNYVLKLQDAPVVNQRESSGCLRPQTYNTIAVNNVSSKYYSGGDMGWNIFSNQMPCYEFPKGSGKMAGGAAALWIGGIDANGQLKLAAMTYRQNGVDFWPGPLDTITGSIPSDFCNAFDVAPLATTSDINAFRSDVLYAKTSAHNYTLNINLDLWPANTKGGSNVTSHLAPYVDANKNGIYDPVPGGDYPDIKGDAMMYFVMNDAGNVHTESQAAPVRTEIHHSVYAYGCEQTLDSFPQLRNVVFHHYKIYNRSSLPLSKTVVGMWSASCIGDGKDDYVGSNANKGYGYYFNGDGYDNVYGNILPATGIAVLKAPLADNNDQLDNNGNGVVDEPNEEMLAPNVFYYRGAMPVYGIPSQDTMPQTTNPDHGSPIHYYNYLTGSWKDGSSFICGSNAYSTNPGTAMRTKHVFPEDAAGSDCNRAWTEKSENNPPGERSVLVCTQPFTLKAYSSVEIEFAFITAVDSTKPGDNWAAVTKLKSEVQKVKTFYALSAKPTCIVTPSLQPFVTPSVEVFPNPSEGKLMKIISPEKILKYTLTDLYSHIVFVAENVNAQAADLDMSRFPGGTYFIKIETITRTVTKKIVHL